MWRANNYNKCEREMKKNMQTNSKLKMNNRLMNDLTFKQNLLKMLAKTCKQSVNDHKMSTNKNNYINANVWEAKRDQKLAGIWIQDLKVQRTEKERADILFSRTCKMKWKRLQLKKNYNDKQMNVITTLQFSTAKMINL